MIAGDDIDDEAYRHGMASFDAGVTLREVFEIIAADASGSASEVKTMSFVLGYADGALGALRRAAAR